MRKNILLLFLVANMNIFAQKELKEGTITIKMTMSSDNEQVMASLAMVGDINLTTYFKGQKSRTEMESPMTGKNINIVDNDTKEVLVLMDNPMLGKKFLKQDIKKSEEELKDVTVTANGKTKTVVGYECKGYNVVTKQQGIELKMTMYVTDKILAQEQYSAMLGGKIKGFPMYLVLTMNQGGMPITTTMEVTEVKNESVDDSKFEMNIPEDYSEMQMPSAK